MFYENIVVRGYLDRNSLTSLNNLFEVYLNTFNRLAKEDKEIEREKSEFVKYKTRDHKIETEEEKEERRFKELFPDYEGDYGIILHY